MAKILMVGAFDTKGPEYAFLRDQIIARGHEVLAMNTGVIGEAEAFAVDFGADEELSHIHISEPTSPRMI